MASSVSTEGYFVEVVALVESIPRANLYSVAIGVSAFLIVRLMKRYAPRIPGALVALVLLTVVVAVFDLPARGVGVLGAIPSGAPSLTLPAIPVADYLRLLPSALAIVAILLCEGLLVVRSYSSKYGYKVDGDQMLFAWGAANLAAGFTGSLVTGNSPSRSAAMDASGARSQLPSLVAAVTIAVVLLFFTDLLAFLPNAALAGIVANAVLSLIEVHELRELWHMRRSEFWIAAVCLLSVLALGPLRAVAIAFLLSTIDVIRRAASPETSALMEAPDGSHFVPLDAGQASGLPGLVVYRFGAPLYFANATRFLDDVERLATQGPVPVRWFVLDAEAMVDVDTDGRGRAQAGDGPAGQPGHHLRRQPRRPALPFLAGEVRPDGAHRPGPVLPDQPARGGGVSRGGTMKAITVEPGKGGTARFEDIPEPDAREGSVLVEAVAVGVCGTDVEIAEGKYGWAPPGHTRLVLGHESLGRVLDPGPSGGLKKGDLVVGIVRRPDPVPCPACAVGEWDMCRNGQYTERGIKQIHGFMSERWRIEPEYAMKVDPSLGLLGVLLEPMTVIAKALEQVVMVGRRSFWEAETVLVTGAGPIGLLAACGARLFGKEVHVLDRVETGPKPDLVRALGATYHSGSVLDVPLEPDAIIECTGVGAVIADSFQKIASGGVVCLTGVGQGGRSGYAVADVSAKIVLRNNVIVGSVNANKRHWYKASQALAAGRPRVALPPDHAPREAAGLREGAGQDAGRHQGRRPVLGSLTQESDRIGSQIGE